MQAPDKDRPASPFGDREAKPGKGFQRLERLVRVGALFLLCGLVWYFSYDHGRSDSSTVADKLELENISLREKLVLAEAELVAAKESLAAMEAAMGAAAGGETAGEDGQAGQDGAAAPVVAAARERVTLREKQNVAAFGGEAILSLVSLDIIDQEVTLRIERVKGRQREAHVMGPGDSVEFDLGGQPHSLYLDQIRGNMAFFILDGLPAPAQPQGAGG
ncbi:MAG: hypothetical protein LBF58_11940 [Deltaproteobacteria bacterium]|jgi:hypothetical protein|nr:hypothetical protein [Deltaproteobacteria bacterium]